MSHWLWQGVYHHMQQDEMADTWSATKLLKAGNKKHIPHLFDNVWPHEPVKYSWVRYEMMMKKKTNALFLLYKTVKSTMKIGSIKMFRKSHQKVLYLVMERDTGKHV